MTGPRHAKVLLSDDYAADALAAQSIPPQRNQPREVIAQTEQQAEYMHTLEEKMLGQKSFNVYVSNTLSNH